MNLAQAIHQQWAAATDLDDLLPASRFFTGLAIDGVMPYATLSLASKRPASRLPQRLGRRNADCDDSHLRPELRRGGRHCPAAQEGLRWRRLRSLGQRSGDRRAALRRVANPGRRRRVAIRRRIRLHRLP